MKSFYQYFMVNNLKYTHNTFSMNNQCQDMFKKSIKAMCTCSEDPKVQTAMNECRQKPPPFHNQQQGPQNQDGMMMHPRFGGNFGGPPVGQAEMNMGLPPQHMGPRPGPRELCSCEF